MVVYIYDPISGPLKVSSATTAEGFLREHPSYSIISRSKYQEYQRAKVTPPKPTPIPIVPTQPKPVAKKYDFPAIESRLRATGLGEATIQRQIVLLKAKQAGVAPPPPPKPVIIRPPKPTPPKVVVPLRKTPQQLKKERLAWEAERKKEPVVKEYLGGLITVPTKKPPNQNSSFIGNRQASPNDTNSDSRTPSSPRPGNNPLEKQY